MREAERNEFGQSAANARISAISTWLELRRDDVPKPTLLRPDGTRVPMLKKMLQYIANNHGKHGTRQPMPQALLTKLQACRELEPVETVITVLWLTGCRSKEVLTMRVSQTGATFLPSGKAAVQWDTTTKTFHVVHEKGRPAAKWLLKQYDEAKALGHDEVFYNTSAAEVLLKMRVAISKVEPTVNPDCTPCGLALPLRWHRPARPICASCSMAGGAAWLRRRATTSMLARVCC